MKIRKRLNHYNIDNNPLRTPYNTKIYKLNEEFHIYQRNNQKYLNTLERAFIKCIIDLENNTNLVSIDNTECLYSKTIFHVDELKDIADDITLYVIIDYSVTQPLRDAILICSKEEIEIEAEDEDIKYNSEIINENGNHPVIILYIDSNYKKQDNRFYVSSIEHECIHLLHKTKHDKIVNNAGVAFTYAYNLGKLFEIDNIINYENFLDFDNPNIICDNRRIIATFAAAMYSLSISEIEAWIHSFNGRDLSAIKRDKNYLEKHELSDLIKRIPEYQHYALLNNLITKYRNKFDNIYHLIKHKQEAVDIVKQYFMQCYNLKLEEPFNLSTFIEHIWMPAIQKILKRMQKIHFKNLKDQNLV